MGFGVITQIKQPASNKDGGKDNEDQYAAHGWYHFRTWKRETIVMVQEWFPNPDLDQMQNRSIVLIGLMGVGKTTIGRRLAKQLGMPFHDADAEIEKAAGRSVKEIFQDFGENAFRDGERKVISRLLEGSPIVLATGGGAWLDEDTRARVKAKAVSVWLKADVDVLVQRTARRNTRPLLADGDPKTILAELIQVRNPVYAQADLHVDSCAGPHETTVDKVMEALAAMNEQKG